MAKLTKEDFISSLKEMNLLEIKELVDAMKEEFGVDPSAVAVAAPAAGGAEASAAPSTVTVSIADAGAAKVAVIKIVKEITGLGLKESKDIVDNKGVVKENIPTAEADEIKWLFMNEKDSNLISISKKIKKRDIYVDSDNMDSLIDDIVMNFEIIGKSLNDVESILNKSIYKKIFEGNDIEKVLNLCKDFSFLVDRNLKVSSNLETKYNFSVKDYDINQLNERIDILERKIDLITEIGGVSND